MSYTVVTNIQWNDCRLLHSSNLTHWLKVAYAYIVHTIHIKRESVGQKTGTTMILWSKVLLELDSFLKKLTRNKYCNKYIVGSVTKNFYSPVTGPCIFCTFLRYYKVRWIKNIEYINFHLIIFTIHIKIKCSTLGNNLLSMVVRDQGRF